MPICPNSSTEAEGSRLEGFFKCSTPGSNHAEFVLGTQSSMCIGCPARRKVNTAATAGSVKEEPQESMFARRMREARAQQQS